VVHPGVQFEIVGEDGGGLPHGETGQIRLRGPGMSTRYLDDAEATARAFRGGWFYPGDMVFIDADGVGYFKGRSDDMMNFASINVFPSEIERVIEGFSGVTECAAFATTTAGERLQLTPAAAGQVGGAWYLHKRYLAVGFETTFEFRLSSASDGGGEGFAFVIQNNPVPALGPAGAAIGYGGVFNSLAVEFDTRQSSSTDLAAGHISVQARGTAGSPVTNSADHASSLGAVTEGFPDFTDGNVHTARVAYASSSLEVYMDGGATPVLVVPLVLESVANLDRGQALFGFTAANGEGFHTHEILSWSVTIAATPVEVNIQTPLDGASFVAPAEVNLTASATAAGAEIVRVEYYAGGRKIGEASASPFSFMWEGALPGLQTLTATALR
jgi:acyl-CoA synthetase (AMP-forming)/AMP-acid ligase II